MPGSFFMFSFGSQRWFLKKQKRAIARFLMFQVDLLMYSEKIYLFIPIAIRKKLSSSHITETEPLQANNRSWNSELKLERATRFELATPSLGSLYSTNWAMPAHRPLQKVPFRSISASGSNFNPRNTQCMSADKIWPFLELQRKWTFCKGLFWKPCKKFLCKSLAWWPLRPTFYPNSKVSLAERLRLIYLRQILLIVNSFH